VGRAENDHHVQCSELCRQNPRGEFRHEHRWQSLGMNQSRDSTRRLRSSRDRCGIFFQLRDRETIRREGQTSPKVSSGRIRSGREKVQSYVQKCIHACAFLYTHLRLLPKLTPTEYILHVYAATPSFEGLWLIAAGFPPNHVDNSERCRNPILLVLLAMQLPVYGFVGQ
jgi:hypothetical protein